MYFRPFGPFDLTATLAEENRYWRRDFWEIVDRECQGLSGSNGVYIFSLKYSSNFRPWYVGKTCSSAGFAGEVFQGHKMNHYYSASEQRRGRPFLHLIARVEEARGNFCSWSDRTSKQVEDLETYLIGMAVAANPDLRNNKKTSFFRDLDIEGVIGPRYEGRPREAARSLKNVLGIALP